MTRLMGLPWVHPLATVLANLFMGHHEKIWLEQYQGPEVLFYRRYVDDTFCLFHSEQDAIAFFDHVLPFLDVLIDNTHRGSVVTSTFRKKTFAGLLTIARNSEPDKLRTIDSLSIKNFVFLAFDWSINFENHCRFNMATRDRPSVGFSCFGTRFLQQMPRFLSRLPCR